MKKIEEFWKIGNKQNPKKPLKNSINSERG